jgi:hypothetical protein
MGRTARLRLEKRHQNQEDFAARRERVAGEKRLLLPEDACFLFCSFVETNAKTPD